MEHTVKTTVQDFTAANAVNLLDIYDDSVEAFDEHRLFIAYFNTIPNKTDTSQIDCKKANQWFTNSYQAEIQNHHYINHYFGKKIDNYCLYYTLYEDLLIYFNTVTSRVTFLYRKTSEDKVVSIINGIKKFPKRKSREKPEIELLTYSCQRIATHSFEISKPRLNLEDNYNENLLPVHETILKRLSQKNDKGLVLLHGKPGTGKTSYIRYLISKVRKKKIIFLPPNMAAAITNPDLMSVLIDNPNSIFVIEDAENIIVDRDKDGNSPVSALLNIADGLLSDCLNIQIICSFNTDITRVDNALMRKGRLIAKYEFCELEADKAQALSNKLGFSSVIDAPMTLTAIYNQDESDFQPTRRRNAIGFRAIHVEKQAI